MESQAWNWVEGARSTHIPNNMECAQVQWICIVVSRSSQKGHFGSTCIPLCCRSWQTVSAFAESLHKKILTFGGIHALHRLPYLCRNPSGFNMFHVVIPILKALVHELYDYVAVVGMRPDESILIGILLIAATSSVAKVGRIQSRFHLFPCSGRSSLTHISRSKDED